MSVKSVTKPIQKSPIPDPESDLRLIFSALHVKLLSQTVTQFHDNGKHLVWLGDGTSANLLTQVMKKKTSTAHRRRKKMREIERQGPREYSGK